MPRQAQSKRQSLALSPQDRARIDAQLRLFEAARALLPQDPIPYVAHIRIAHEERILNVLFAGTGRDDREWESLVGHEARALADGGGERTLVVDWQRSPLAEIFFSCSEGQDYELVVRRKTLRGALLEWNLVGFANGNIVEIVTPEARLFRDENGDWHSSPRREPKLLPRSREARARPPSLIDVTLDDKQRSVVAKPPGGALLLLGEAGHGKTTVALHRLAHLVRASKEPLRAAVIVPTEGLRALLELLMKRLGIDVRIFVYDRFARWQARRAFADIPRRESEDTTASVIRIKRDPALRTVLRTLARRRPGHLDDDPEAPVKRSKAFAKHADLQHLFGDSRLLRGLAGQSNQRITERMIADTLEHTRVQFSQTSEEEWSHVIDKERLVPVDRLSLDDGTPMQNARTIDTEDYAVLFELDKERAERKGRKPTMPPKQYDLIVIDEAQEFASLELSLIGRSLKPSGTLIVAGDADQQLDPAAVFEGWERTMEDLGHREHDRVVLEVGYRCPPKVAALAKSLRSDVGDVAMPEVEISRFETRCHLSVWLIEELRRLAERDPNASVAILCRSPVTATRLARVLSHGVASRLVLDGRFVFRSGISITSIDQVKGLEFDYVIVPDASASTYPDTPQARRALYVAVTRARHQLLLASVGKETPLFRARS